MNTINPNDPAYPTIESINHSGDVIEIKTKESGLSIRAAIASNCMAALLNAQWKGGFMMQFPEMAERSAQAADALIAELNYRQK